MRGRGGENKYTASRSEIKKLLCQLFLDFDLLSRNVKLTKALTVTFLRSLYTQFRRRRSRRSSSTKIIDYKQPQFSTKKEVLFLIFYIETCSR